MDPREMETLVQRLVQNPHDQDTITYAHQAGQSDPKSYAMLLEKVGTATSDPAFACHWLTEAANVWSTTLGDAHRAARALMIAIDRDPTQATPAERLAELYRDKGDSKALVALLERRAKALAPLASQAPELRAQIAAIHEELGQLWQTPPLAQPRKAIENYRRAVEYDPGSQYSIYALRELYKAAEQWSEAIPYFEMEQNLVTDNERKVALYQDEGDVRKSARDFVGSAAAFRRARALDTRQDATLKQQLGTAILERVQAGQSVPQAELSEGATLFVELAEEYPGEHGLSYSMCALELVPTHDRAVQLAMYYGEQLNRVAEVAPRAASYLKANPQGALVAEARKLVTESMEAGGDDSLLDALAPPPGADASERVQALVEVAQTLARKAKKNDAAAKFREVLTIEPANVEAIGFLEPFLRQTRKFPDLREILLAAGSDESADTDQRQSWLREVVGLCETQLRDIDGAIVALKALLVLDADDEPARGALKRLLEKQARWDELAALMAEEAEQTLDIEARISLEKGLAKLHEQKRKDPVATGEAWSRIAALASGDEEAITTAVRYFEKGERIDLAIQVIAENIEAIADEVQRGALLKKLGELREASGEALSAGEAFAEAANLLKSASLWESAEGCFVTAEAWDQAATAVDERAQLAELAPEKASLFAAEADYLSRAGDDSSSVLRLEQATELDPVNDSHAAALEQRYLKAERNEDLAGFLLRRADKLSNGALRSVLRKRAATIQREVLGNPEAARLTLQELLKDGDDREALETLADDAEERSEFKEAVALLARLEKASTEPVQHVTVLLRQAALVADGLDDPKAAIAVYERLLKEFDPKHEEALGMIAALYERLDEPKGVVGALERRLLVLTDKAEQLNVAEKLALIYDETLEDAKAAVRALDRVRELDPENFAAVGRLVELCEKLEDWPRVAKHLAELIELEGDEQEISRMTRRLAEILHEKVKKSDEALAALMQIADAGDEPCREEYVRLGDVLGWKGVVATKLVEWYLEAPISPARNASLRGAFDRFVEVGRDADAASVAKELARTRGADAELAQTLEQIAVKLRDLDALGIAHDLLVQSLNGPARADEMVRQAEVLAEAGVDSTEAINHGEQALTSVPPADVEPLLARLAKLTSSVARVIEIYERQVTRCKAPSDKLAALGRAASVAASHGAYDKARAFFDVALGGAVQEETLNSLEAIARSSDAEQKGEKLRRTLAEALANGGQGSRDGGRTRGMLLGRAAELAHGELKDTEQAFIWLGDAVVTHVDDEPLSALERLADEVGEPKRAEAVLNRALEEVFDGPLVRKLLARRATVRREKLADAAGAASDLKRLHDLSPADTAVMDQLSQLYVELEDYRGMVQLYEDQILRGKDPAARAELARKVARLWEEKLSDPREAADAWRRVLRMKAQDPEAVEGLERAKANMLKRPASEPANELPVVERPSEKSVEKSRPGKPRKAGEPAQATEPAHHEEPPIEGPPAVAPSAASPDAAVVDALTGDSPAAETAPSPAATDIAPNSTGSLAAETTSSETTSSETTSSETTSSETTSSAPASDETKPTPEVAIEPSSPRASAVPPPLPAGVMLEGTEAGPRSPLTNGVAASHEEDVQIDDPEQASAPPPVSSPWRRGPPPKPSTAKGAPLAAPSSSIRPPPPSRTGGPPAHSSGAAALKPPPPPTGSGRPPPPPTAPGAGAARPAPPPPPGSRSAGKPPPPPGAGQALARPAASANASEEGAPGTRDDDDEDELTVDEDELIDDGLA